MKKTLFFILGVGVGVLFSIAIYNHLPQTILQYAKTLYNKEAYSSGFESPSRASEKYTFGLDVSKYQGSIKWDSVKQSHHPIKYVFIRSTMGDDRKDIKFKYNWKEVKRIGLIRGAYHYYDPNENSTKQANNFIASVKLEKGDLPPVLDIEADSKYGEKNLIKNLKNWIKIIENHYGAKPIIYSTRGRHTSIIKKHFSEYPGWVASYTSKNKIKNIKWDFHQFSDNIRVKGIPINVDGNDYNGNLKDLNRITIKRGAVVEQAKNNF